MSLKDPIGNCLPKRLLTLNLSRTPFTVPNNQTLLLYKCTKGYVSEFLVPISCLGGANYSVMSSFSKRNKEVLSKCQDCGSIVVSSGMYIVDVVDELRLIWIQPDCSQCYIGGGKCGLKRSSGSKVVCTGISVTSPYAFIFAFIVPVILFMLGSFCLICIKDNHHHHHNTDWTTSGTHLLELIGMPSIQHQANRGLDQLTIDSYPVVVLDETKILPSQHYNHDNSCSICLSDYQPEESLRTLPGCHHCFHASCIDQWPRLKAICPVCRLSLPPLS